VFVQEDDVGALALRLGVASAACSRLGRPGGGGALSDYVLSVPLQDLSMQPAQRSCTTHAPRFPRLPGVSGCVRVRLVSDGDSW
jgi:hypothetical protein